MNEHDETNVPPAPPAPADDGAAEKAAAAAAAKAAKDAEKAEKKAAKEAEKAAKAAEREAKKAEREAAKAAKAAEREANKMPEQNGIRHPKPGGKCAAVWDIADGLRATNDEVPAMSDVIEVVKERGLSEGNARTEYARWRTFHGIAPVGRKKKEEAVPPAPPAPPSE